MDLGAACYDGLQAAAEAARNPGDLHDRLSALCWAAARQPQRADLHNNIGLLLHTLHRSDEALECLARALTLQPAYAAALNNQGLCHAALGRAVEARASYEAALTHDPHYPEAANNLGALLYSTGEVTAALEQLRIAVSYRPDFAEARTNLAHVLGELDRPAEAALEYERVIEEHGGTADLHSSLGTARHASGRYADARLAFERALELQPDHAQAWAGLSTVHLHLGQLEEARAGFELAVTLEPNRPRHLLNLARSGVFRRDSPHLASILAIEADLPTLADEDRVDAHFALAKVLDDIGEHDRAFGHLVSGNELKRRRTSYDPAHIASMFRLIRRKFTAAVLRDRVAKPQSVGDTPIFIVGMPRSGSTLVEQVLAAHAKVRATGEVDHFETAIRRVRADSDGSLFGDRALDPDDPQIDLIRRRYSELLFDAQPNPDGRAGVAVVTDKMLSNFRFLGLVHLAFPNAPIIHTTRNPVDTCLSCFGIQFAKLPFTYDLSELGGYYREYAALMDHWRGALPAGRVLDVRYEDVVSSFEGQARRILDHCGLEWSDSCLRFHEVNRPVRTASVAQVRQPLYTTSVGRWRPSPETLAPLMSALGDAGRVA